MSDRGIARMTARRQPVFYKALSTRASLHSVTSMCSNVLANPIKLLEGHKVGAEAPALVYPKGQLLQLFPQHHVRLGG